MISNSSFGGILAKIHERGHLNRLVVDEAHCISVRITYPVSACRRLIIGLGVGPRLSRGIPQTWDVPWKLSWCPDHGTHCQRNSTVRLVKALSDFQRELSLTPHEKCSRWYHWKPPIGPRELVQSCTPLQPRESLLRGMLSDPFRRNAKLISTRRFATWLHLTDWPWCLMCMLSLISYIHDGWGHLLVLYIAAIGLHVTN